MGQAKKRGTFEERKAQALARKEEERKRFLEARRIEEESRQAAAMVRREGIRQRKIGIVGGSGFGRSRSLVLAAMLAASLNVDIRSR